MNSILKAVSPDRDEERPDTHAGERGAVMVEAAMITVFLMMMLLGTVTSAVAYSQKTSLQTAAREASRFGATLPVNADMNGWLNQVLGVAKAAAHKDLANGVPGQRICVAYVHPNGSSATDRNTRLIQTGGITGTPTTGPTATCFDDGRPADERRVQVLVERTTTIQAVVFAVDVNHSLRSAARFERGS